MSNRLDRSIFGEEHDNAPGPQAPPEPTTRRERRRAEELAARRGEGTRSNRPSGLRRLLVVLAALAVIGGGGFVAWKVLTPMISGLMESDDYSGPGTSEVRFTVASGDTGSAIAKKLVEADIVKSTKAYVSAAGDNAKSQGIQPGVYLLKKQMAASEVVAVLVEPKNRVVDGATVPEGLWVSEILPRLSTSTGVPLAQYQAAIKDAKALGLPASAKGNPEGYLFPATYEFDPGTSAAAQLKAMVANANQRLTAAGVKAADAERILTIASIVQAEAHKADDMGRVSRVIYNRLAQGMSLGMDTTVNYIYKKRGVPSADMLANPSPYNTRIHTGLPPGPIGNPGDAAIKAAVNPTVGDWLYFTTVNLDTGETKFTADAAEHERNAAQFAAWCTANPGKC